MTQKQPQSAPNGLVTAGLTPRQEAAALALAAGCTIGQAAKKSGAGARTVRTWMTGVPAFASRIAALRGELTSCALGRLVDAMSLAADTLRKLLNAKGEGIRFAAAKAVLELGTKLRESAEMERELDELRADLAELKAKRRSMA